MTYTRRSTTALLIAFSALGFSGGCWSQGTKPEVVVYTALDAEFSAEILAQFESETGIAARAKFDVESTKTVGLVEAIIAEQKRPRCDVFWNNEIMHTLRLEQQGLLDVYISPQAADYPEMVRSPDGRWCGFAARARVLLVNTKLVPEVDRPKLLLDLLDPRWKGRVAVAKPLFGTTATHAACLFEVWGEQKAQDFFRGLKANEVQILSGNKQAALAVSSGQAWMCLTDTDDAVVEIEKGAPAAIVYLDREPDQLGTLFIPNTLSILKNCPHPAEARKLVDYLLTPAVEGRLASSASAQIPLNSRTTVQPRVETPRTVHPMSVDFSAASLRWESASRFLRDEFTAE